MRNYSLTSKRQYINILLNALLCCFLISIAGCSTTKKRIAHFEPIEFSQIEGWKEDNHVRALEAFLNSCEKIITQKPEDNISSITEIGGKAKDWQEPCVFAMFKGNDISAKQFFESWFTPYKITDDRENNIGTLTGYYEIELEAHHKPTKEFRYPIYRKPHNLNELKSASIQRRHINSGWLHGKGLEIAWTNSHPRLYFMHVQGSGRLKMKNGKHMRISYAGTNGHRFSGISSALSEKGAKAGSTKDVIDWLHKNSHYQQEIINSDPSYVFFIENDSPHTIGSHGVGLTPERSIAIDAGLYPYGAPIWVANSKKRYNKLLVAQDRGGAIKGAIRGDVFFGSGRVAEDKASGFKQQTKFYALFPKTVIIPKQYEARN